MGSERNRVIAPSQSHSWINKTLTFDTKFSQIANGGAWLEGRGKLEGKSEKERNRKTEDEGTGEMRKILGRKNGTAKGKHTRTRDPSLPLIIKMFVCETWHCAASVRNTCQTGQELLLRGVKGVLKPPLTPLVSFAVRVLTLSPKSLRKGMWWWYEMEWVSYRVGLRIWHHGQETWQPCFSKSFGT